MRAETEIIGSREARAGLATTWRCSFSESLRTCDLGPVPLARQIECSLQQATSQWSQMDCGARLEMQLKTQDENACQTVTKQTGPSTLETRPYCPAGAQEALAAIFSRWNVGWESMRR
ncbi:hypothetical protein RB195_017578 [Necator americanus]|uniref:Uncharacterized protein n=1 Tax=Necator americanus TaxID=51031 RepID=A0ABR1C5V2_NECAM